MKLAIDEILNYLPHRYPFLLLDQVDELAPGKHIVGRKNISANEPYLQGHFADYPIMPGVLIVEALAQLCCVLAFETRGRKPADGYLHYLAGVDGARFKRPVRPGDVLALRGSVASERRQLMKFDCQAHVDGELACAVTLICVERKLAGGEQVERRRAPAGRPAAVDPRAVVDPAARLGRNVTVGPWTVIGPDVVVGDDCEIGPHVVLRGPTTLGRGNRIYQFATVGEGSPAFAYKDEPTTLAIGDDNVIREGVTIHRGLATDRSRTEIGSGNLLMAYVHVGHDCVLGDRIVMANNASVAGHVTVGDEAVLSGYVGVPQFRSIGAYAFVGAMSLVAKDVPAYVSISGNPAGAVGLNLERLRRLGASEAVKKALQDAYRVVYRRGLTVPAALAELRPAAAEVPEVARFVQSIEASEHGIVRERRRQ